MTSPTTRPRTGDVKARGWTRHLEGWQPGLLAVVIAVIAAILLVPSSVPPRDVPEPRIDHRAVQAVLAEDVRLAREAESQTLHHDVRLLGAAVRQFGAVDGTEDKLALTQARARLARAAPLVAARPDEEVVMLRAYQVHKLVAGLREWERSGESPEMLKELGGTILETLDRYGWVSHERGRRRIVLSDLELSVLLKKRWNDVTNLDRPALAPTKDEELALLRFFLRHPISAPEALAQDALGAAQYRQRYVLKKVEEIGKLDADYPTNLAKGILLYRLGKQPEAVQAFRRHLEARPDGPYTLRAQNYLRAALGASSDELD
jgi:hypothetical protein